MLKLIIQNEWRLWRRDSRTAWMSGSIAIMSILALAMQLTDARSKLESRQKAQEASRKEWMLQGEKHPHMAAHFGNYAYKKPTMLNVFDPGITIFTGTSVYLEPHRQNDFQFNESGERDTGARFGWFTPSFICQFIIPLLIFLLTFNSMTSERIAGTYSLLLAQGVALRSMLWAKAGASFFIFAGFITLYMIFVSGASYVLMPSSEDSLSSFFYLWLAYLLYYAIWCLIGVSVSAIVKSAGASISLLLLFWITTSIILPRLAASAAENAYPLTTNYAFKRKVAEDIVNGLDGHDLQSNRAKRVEDSVLKAYGVDSVQHLKFNFEGYMMQQGEEFSSTVYDKHFGSVYKTLQDQRRLQSFFSVISPFMMLRNNSMAASNTSMETEIHFQQAAEGYRRSFVQQMNNDMILHSSYGDWDKYKVKNSLYGAVRDFEVVQKSLLWRLKFTGIEQVVLLLWLGLLIVGIWIISRKKGLIA